MQKHIIIVILTFCLLAVGCGGEQKARDTHDTLLRTLATKQYSPELIRSAIDYQDKDTLALALDIVIAQCPEKDADSIVKRSLNRFAQVSAERSPDGRKTSMKRVRALVAERYLNHGDTTRALAMLDASLRDTVPTKVEAVKNLEHDGRLVTEMLLAKGDIRGAVETYLRNLDTCNSVIVALVDARDVKSRLKDSLVSVLLVLLVLGIITFALFFVDRLRSRHYDNEEEYQSVIAQLQSSTDSYQQMLASLESQQTDNRREVDMLHRQIDKIQETMMQRMQTGKIIYETLLRGDAMPHTLKDADSYLIDYMMIFFPEKYKQWQQAYDKVTPRAFTYLILSDMGHSDTAIQEILSISASSVRSIKSRLNARRR